MDSVRGLGMRGMEVRDGELFDDAVDSVRGRVGRAADGAAAAIELVDPLRDLGTRGPDGLAAGDGERGIGERGVGERVSCGEGAASCDIAVVNEALLADDSALGHSCCGRILAVGVLGDLSGAGDSVRDLLVSIAELVCPIEDEDGRRLMPSGGLAITEGTENVDETLEPAVEIALPRGTRRPEPGPDAAFGMDTEAERRLENEFSLRDRPNLDGTGEAKRLGPVSYTESGCDEELTESER